MLSLASLFSFLNAEASSKCIVEGEKIINSRFLIDCGKLEADQTGEVEILGLVLQTSAPFDMPHVITGVFSLEDNIVKVKLMKCTCKAEERCKHIAAVLIHFTRINIKDVEVFSRTNVQRLWEIRKGPISEQFATKKLCETDCLRESFEKVSLPPIDADKEYFDRLIACVPDSNLAKHMKGTKIVGAGTSSSSNIPQTSDKTVQEYLFKNVLDNPICCDEVDEDVLPECCENQISKLN